MAGKSNVVSSAAKSLTGDGLGSVAKSLAGAMGKKMLSNVGDRISATTQRLTDYADNGGGPGLLKAVTGGGGGGGKTKNTLKVTNIVEEIDVAIPVRLAYDQWTRFTDFPQFMKKVENVGQESDEKLHWKAQVFWSHREWESTIIDQVPDEHITWRSEGAKGSVDGTVTFHELAPRLTRIVLVLEYHPQGFFEKTGNLWRAQGRRARLELKHFARHVMTEAALDPESVEGWRGEIHDGEVTKDNETAREEESARAEEQGEQAPSGEERRPRGRRDTAEEEDQAEERGGREEARRRGGEDQARRPSRPEARPERRAPSGREEGTPRRPVRRGEPRPAGRGRE